MRARIIGVAAALVTTAAGIVATGAPVDAATLDRCKRVQLISHRGLVDRTATENTIRGLANAYRRGAGRLETDLQLTADKRWVLMHDDTITRTTNGTGTVASKTVAQLKAYRTNDGLLGGIPRLSQAMAFLKSRPLARMQLEIKPDTVDDAAIWNILNLANDYGVKSRLAIISFASAPLSAVRRLDPAMRSGLVTRGQVYATRVKRYGSIALVPQRFITPGYVSYLHRNGILVNAWVVNRRLRWRHIVRSGVNSITTDTVPSLRRYCATR